MGFQYFQCNSKQALHLLASSLTHIYNTWLILANTPVAYTIKFYNRKFAIVNYASVWSISYDRNLQS
jgi:hypothetical protein